MDLGPLGFVNRSICIFLAIVEDDFTGAFDKNADFSARSLEGNQLTLSSRVEWYLIDDFKASLDHLIPPIKIVIIQEFHLASFDRSAFVGHVTAKADPVSL